MTGETNNIERMSIDGTRGLTAMCTALENLRKVANHTEDRFNMEQVLLHLARAAAVIPDELFATMFAAKHVGMHEIAERLQAAVRREADIGLRRNVMTGLVTTGRESHEG